MALFSEENANKVTYISPCLHNAFHLRWGLLLSQAIVTISKLGELGLPAKFPAGSARTVPALTTRWPRYARATAVVRTTYPVPTVATLNGPARPSDIMILSHQPYDLRFLRLPAVGEPQGSSISRVTCSFKGRLLEVGFLFMAPCRSPFDDRCFVLS